jgi:hypothetical protein
VFSLAPSREDVTSGDVVVCILKLGTRWRWVVNFTPSLFYFLRTHWAGGWRGPSLDAAGKGKTSTLLGIEPIVLGHLADWKPLAVSYDITVITFLKSMHVQWIEAVVPKLFRSTAPLVPYTHPQRPLPFLKKHKCAFASTFILYLKNRLNNIIRVKLNILSVN